MIEGGRYTEYSHFVVCCAMEDKSQQASAVQSLDSGHKVSRNILGSRRGWQNERDDTRLFSLRQNPENKEENTVSIL